MGQEPFDIWVVDGDPNTLAVLETLRGREAWSLSSFTRAREVIDAAKHRGPDLLLLDLNTPSFDGLELMRHLRRLPAFRAVPIIIMTIHASEEILAEAIDMGAADLLAKPLRNVELYSRIRAQLRTRQLVLDLEHKLSELQHTKDFLANLIDSSVDAIVAADIRGTVIVFNKAAGEVLGYDAAHVIGRLKAWEIYPGDMARHVMTMLRSAERGGVGRLSPTELELLDRDGRCVPVSMSGALLYEDGVEAASVGVFNDLREKQQMQRQLAQANEALEQARRQVVTAELAGAAAHELNQPLTSALGYAELLKMRLPENDPSHGAADMVLEQIRRMAQIVRRMGQLNTYKTRTYIGHTQIVDLSSTDVGAGDE